MFQFSPFLTIPLQPPVRIVYDWTAPKCVSLVAMLIALVAPGTAGPEEKFTVSGFAGYG